jgi:hypothetical protein
MGLVISKGLTLRKGYIGTDDPDAEAYIAAVEAADEAASPGIGALETATKVAIHSFVKGAKADGFWPAIKSSCILAGARTRLGALTPLVGTAPTSFNFVDGDYNRKTGLVGNGSTKYLNSNRNNNADPQNNRHLAAYATSAPNQGLIGTNAVIAGMSHIFENNGTVSFRLSSDTFITQSVTPSAGLLGASRSNSSAATYQLNGFNVTASLASVAPGSQDVAIFSRNTDRFSNSRLAFYSIGESLNLALLDARVTDLINAFVAAIP